MLSSPTRKIVAASAAALAGLAFAAPASAGVSGPAFWIDGQLYRTVATPTVMPSIVSAVWRRLRVRALNPMSIEGCRLRR